MTQKPLEVSDDTLTRIPDRVIGTEWFGNLSFDLSDIVGLAEREIDPAHESEQQRSSTVQSSSAILKRLDDTIDAVSSVAQTTSKERFNVLQEWEGVVSEIGDETFVARLIDITCKGHPEEDADFQIEDIRRDDLELLRPGAVFRWIIGYDIKKDGAKSRASQIVFRRLPQWTKKEIEDADREAQFILSNIEWE